MFCYIPLYLNVLQFWKPAITSWYIKISISIKFCNREYQSPKFCKGNVRSLCVIFFPHAAHRRKLFRTVMSKKSKNFVYLQFYPQSNDKSLFVAFPCFVQAAYVWRYNVINIQTHWIITHVYAHKQIHSLKITFISDLLTLELQLIRLIFKSQHFRNLNIHTKWGKFRVSTRYTWHLKPSAKG